MAGEFQVEGQNEMAPFTLKIHRGDGMALLAMNWEERQAAGRFCRVCHRVPRAQRGSIFRAEESHRIPR